MRLFISFCLLFFFGKTSWTLQRPPSVVSIAFVAYEIVPDLILQPPRHFVRVEYASGVEAILGNIITPTEAKNHPTVSWLAHPFKLYTLACVDPDAVLDSGPGQFLHWLVGNIPGENIAFGEVLVSYYPPEPPAGSGLHRYTFVVFPQKHRITFTEPRNLQMTYDNRTEFSLYNFTRKYNLCDPYAGNFFLSEFGVEGCNIWDSKTKKNKTVKTNLY